MPTRSDIVSPSGDAAPLIMLLSTTAESAELEIGASAQLGPLG